MKTSRRRQIESMQPYCAGCCIRMGDGERRLVKDGKLYHSACYLKIEDEQKEHGRKAPTTVNS